MMKVLAGGAFAKINGPHQLLINYITVCSNLKTTELKMIKENIKWGTFVQEKLIDSVNWPVTLKTLQNVTMKNVKVVQKKIENKMWNVNNQKEMFILYVLWLDFAFMCPPVFEDNFLSWLLSKYWRY